jgi:hypothetical protein
MADFGYFGNGCSENSNAGQPAGVACIRIGEAEVIASVSVAASGQYRRDFR